MEKHALAEHFNGVMMTATGFRAFCPSHTDRQTRSLSIWRGERGWMVKCWSGCSFFDVVSSAGLQPLNFKFGGSDSLAGGPDNIDRTQDIMRDMIRESRDIKWTFGQLMIEAFDLDTKQVRKVLNKYPEFLLVTLPAAMKMHVIMFAGPVAELIGERYYPNYDRDAQGQIGARLWQEYRTQQSSLA